MFQFLDILRMEALSFSKTLVPVLQSTQCHHITPENLNIHLTQLQVLHSLSFLVSKHLSNCMSYEIIISYLSNIQLLVSIVNYFKELRQTEVVVSSKSELFLFLRD